MGRKREFAGSKSGWIITFADLVTLLLALFVLIFSMSSLDSQVVKSISSSVRRDKPDDDLARGRINARVRELAQLLTLKGEVHLNEGRIKELLFPRQLLPPGIDKGTLDTNFRVLKSGEGVTFVIGEELLFQPGTSRISPAGREILQSMAPLLALVQSEVRLTGFYSGALPAGVPDEYSAASSRVLAALGVLVNQGLEPGMFSLSAYGVERDSPEAAAALGPVWVEILLKTGKKALVNGAE